MNENFWTGDKIDTLRELWARGDSAARIAEILRCTRNAVIGKAHRMGLAARPSPILRRPRAARI